MARKRVYLAGPMRGYPHHNYPAFELYAAYLRATGWIVVNPAELSACFGYSAPREDGSFPEIGAVGDRDIPHFIRQDLEAILYCDAIALMPGWEAARGARAERAIAEWAGKPVIEL